MAENLYEGMFLLDSGQFASDPEGMAKIVTDTIEKAGGTLAEHRPWQDGKLAYEIAGRRKGLHYLTYFRMDPSAVTTLNRSVSLTDKILRHLVIQQPQTLFDAMVAALGGDGEEEAAEENSEDAKAESSDEKSDDKPASDESDEKSND